MTRSSRHGYAAGLLAAVLFGCSAPLISAGHLGLWISLPFATSAPQEKR